MGKETYSVYLDNEPWVYDPETKVFSRLEDRNTRVGVADVERQGMHVASLLIVAIRGYPYYHDERLREFRRVGEPTIILTYDQYDLLPEDGQRLSVPQGEAFQEGNGQRGGLLEAAAAASIAAAFGCGSRQQRLMVVGNGSGSVSVCVSRQHAICL